MSMLYLLTAIFAVAFCTPFNTNADQTCQCMSNIIDTVTGSVLGHSHPISGPTIGGQVGGTPCAATCNVTLTFNGNLTNSKPPGADIDVMVCNGLNDQNFVEIYSGATLKKNLTTNSLESTNVTDSNVITFAFHLKTNANVLFYATPVDQIDAPPTTPRAPTTPTYNGPYPVNPALINLDLIIGLDVADANKNTLNGAKNAIQELANTLSYSYDTTRLTLFTFNPSTQFNIGFGSNIPWTSNGSSVSDMLNRLIFIPGSASNIFSQLNNVFFPAVTTSSYSFRNNTERVLIIFTATDAIQNDAVMLQVAENIRKNNLKVIIANTNKTQQYTPARWTELTKLQNNVATAVFFYDFIVDDSMQAQTLLKSNIFNGNKLCGLLENKEDSVSTNIIDIVPLIQITFEYFETNYNVDFIILSIDDVEVARLSGQYGYHPYFCLTPTNYASVRFSSSYGKVYKGFRSQANSFKTYDDCVKTPPSFSSALSTSTKHIKL